MEKKLTVKEQKLLDEKMERKGKLLSELDMYTLEFDKLNDAHDFLQSICVPGTKMKHTAYGDCVVKEIKKNISDISKDMIIVETDNGEEKKLNFTVAVANRILSPVVVDLNDMVKISDSLEILKSEKKIINILKMIKKKLDNEDF